MDLGTSDEKPRKGYPEFGHSQKKHILEFSPPYHSKISSGAPWLHPAISIGKSSRLRIFHFSILLTFENNSKAEHFSKPSHPEKSEPPTPASPASARIDFQVFLWLHKVGIRGIFPQELRRRKDFLRFFFWNFDSFIWGRRIKITPGFGFFSPKKQSGICW